ncbi:DUF962 domain-containing protein [Vulgatibacter incomptus]|uniref:PRS2 protein n=1 Tax=Vulgatibacter incomptus TaxID=1391653 RepID=A0A0K1P9A3_9BACT|nr:Mpo1-like protein [Vulgatibacter incomptus]AKU90100.1 hypothetical protein AKJ08_0487 [Vulgatibacter incomptus]
MNPRMRALFEEYAEAHRHPTNRLTHKIAIPMIVFHIIAMLMWIPLGTVFGLHLTAAHIAFAGAVGWYLSLNVRLGLIMALLYALCFPLAAISPWPVVVGIALVGWLVQLAGHVVWEKRSPAFLRNLLQALVGPLFFVASLTGDWPEKRKSLAGAR